MSLNNLQLFYFFALFCITLTVGGCVQDKCKSVECRQYAACIDGVCTCTQTCQNGGTVTADCTCDCPNGYSGANCETCSQTCQNGGYVNTLNCSCTCPFGYTGENCETPMSKLFLVDETGTQLERYFKIKNDSLILYNDQFNTTILVRSSNCTGDCFWSKGTYPDESLGNSITFFGVDSVHYKQQWFSRNVGIGGGGPYFTYHSRMLRGVRR